MMTKEVRPCHSRVSGNPGHLRVLMDPRLRGNDNTSTVVAKIQQSNQKNHQIKTPFIIYTIPFGYHHHVSEMTYYFTFVNVLRRYIKCVKVY